MNHVSNRIVSFFCLFRILVLAVASLPGRHDLVKYPSISFHARGISSSPLRSSLAIRSIFLWKYVSPFFPLFSFSLFFSFPLFFFPFSFVFSLLQYIWVAGVEKHTPVRQTFLDFFFTFCATFLPHPSASALMSSMSSTSSSCHGQVSSTGSCLYTPPYHKCFFLSYTTYVSSVSLLNANCTSTTRLALFPTRTYPLTEHTFNVRENSIPLHTPQISYVQSFTYAHPYRNMCARDM